MDGDWKAMETLKFMTMLFNHLSAIGAREEMRLMKRRSKLSVIEWIKQGKYQEEHFLEKEAQLFLEYVYVGNRVGAGIRLKILDKTTVFETWKPQWWINLWETLEPLVIHERQVRKNEKLYEDFEWLIKTAKAAEKEEKQD